MSKGDGFSQSKQDIAQPNYGEGYEPFTRGRKNRLNGICFKKELFPNYNYDHVAAKGTRFNNDN